MPEHLAGFRMSSELRCCFFIGALVSGGTTVLQVQAKSPIMHRIYGHAGDDELLEQMQMAL